MIEPDVTVSREKIREVLHMTVLIDHDVINGAQMTRFLHELSENIVKGLFLDLPPTN